MRHRQALHLAVVLWPLLCFVLVGGLRTKHVRYLLPLVPFLALLAGDLCMWQMDCAASWRRLVGVVVVIGVLSTGWYGVAFARIYTGEDSRIQAGRWIVAEAPETHAIGVEQGDFSLGGVGRRDALYQGAAGYNPALQWQTLFVVWRDDAFFDRACRTARLYRVG